MAIRTEHIAMTAVIEAGWSQKMSAQTSFGGRKMIRFSRGGFCRRSSEVLRTRGDRRKHESGPEGLETGRDPTTGHKAKRKFESRARGRKREEGEGGLDLTKKVSLRSDGREFHSKRSSGTVASVSNQTTANHARMNRLLAVILDRTSTRAGTISGVGTQVDMTGRGGERGRSWKDGGSWSCEEFREERPSQKHFFDRLWPTCPLTTPPTISTRKAGCPESTCEQTRESDPHPHSLSSRDLHLPLHSPPSSSELRVQAPSMSTATAPPPKVVLTRRLDPDRLEGATLLAELATRGEIDLTQYDQPGNAPRAWVLEHVKGARGVVVMLGDEASIIFRFFISLALLKALQRDPDQRRVPRCRYGRLLVTARKEPTPTRFLSLAGPSLKVVSTMSAGFDHVDTRALKKRNIRLGTSALATSFPFSFLSSANLTFAAPVFLSFFCW